MNTIDASLRNTKTSGEVNKLRLEGNVPGIIYGGKSETQKISISKKLLKNFRQLIIREIFMIGGPTVINLIGFHLLHIFTLRKSQIPICMLLST